MYIDQVKQFKNHISEAGKFTTDVLTRVLKECQTSNSRLAEEITKKDERNLRQFSKLVTMFEKEVAALVNSAPTILEHEADIEVKSPRGPNQLPELVLKLRPEAVEGFKKRCNQFLQVAKSFSKQVDRFVARTTAIFRYDSGRRFVDTILGSLSDVKNLWSATLKSAPRLSFWQQGKEKSYRDETVTLAPSSVPVDKSYVNLTYPTATMGREATRTLETKQNGQVSSGALTHTPMVAVKLDKSQSMVDKGSSFVSAMWKKVF